jgi:hypothetical protein
MTAQRQSTIAWKTIWKKSRFKVALGLTSLPVIINAKASSLTNTFPEGVSFDTNSFPIAIDLGLLIACPTEERTLKEHSHK